MNWHPKYVLPATLALCLALFGTGCPKDPVCGDGTTDTDEGEECDDGEDNSDTDANACRTDCTNPICGDNVVDTGEECDPPTAGVCTGDCQFLPPPAQCGNGMIEGTEECDDGNTLSGDGCSALCLNEVTPNIGSPCTTADDCGVGGSGLTPRCLAETGDPLGISFPGGMCSATGCDNMVAPCPDSTDPTTGATVVSTCVSVGGVPTCLPECVPTPGGNGSCPDTTAGANDEFAWSCQLDFFNDDEGFCFVGCNNDMACIAGAICLTPENICLRNDPTPGGNCVAAGGTCANDPGTICTVPGDCTGDCDGVCAEDGTTACTANGDCGSVCDGVCAGAAGTACTADGDCTAICDTTTGATCNSGGASCVDDAGCADTCDIGGTNTCVMDGTIACTADADCQLCVGLCANDGTTACSSADVGTACAAACDFTAGLCANDGTTACTMAADPACVPTCDFSAGLCDDGSTACTMAADPLCPGTCTPGTGMACDNNGRSCTVAADCDVRIGDPCDMDAECPQYATCFGSDTDPTFFQDSFQNGFCTILGCGSYDGVAEFACPAGSFCPAATGFNGDTLNYCAPTCTVSAADGYAECETVRNTSGEGAYACHEQMPDGSTTSLADFFDTDMAAGFCHPCDGFWADSAMCP